MPHTLGTEKIRELLPKIDAKELDVELYRQTGIFILRQALLPPILVSWQKAWGEFYADIVAKGRQINPFNTAVVNEPATPALAAIHQNNSLIDIAEKIHGADIALHFQRFLVKDKNNLAPVFLHQDFGYNCGWPDKTMIFVPLNPAGPDNGGLVFHAGTHQYGYLGDAGEINGDAIDPNWPTICPLVNPGDVILMHPFTWHASSAYQQGADRAVAQICYQPANDPSGIALLRGQWRTDVFLGNNSPERLFKRSRTTRLRDLQAEVNRKKDN